MTNVYNFSTPATSDGQEVCSNCSDLEARDVRLTAYVPITPILNRLILEERLSSLKKDDVEAVLKRLYWRVTMVSFPFSRAALTDKPRPVDQSQRTSGDN